MAQALLLKKGLVISLATLKPTEGHTADGIVETLLKHRDDLLRKKGLTGLAILKSVDGTKAGLYELFQEGTDLHSLQVEQASKTIHIGDVDRIADRKYNQFEVLDIQLSEGSSPQIIKGQVLSMVLFTTPDAEKQQIVAHYVGEHMKAAFQGISGLKAGIMLKSLDGSSVALLGYWESLQIVAAQIDHDDQWASLITQLGGAVVAFEKELFVVAELVAK